MVSEYKTKLQISEAENSRLDGAVSPCNQQAINYIHISSFTHSL